MSGDNLMKTFHEEALKIPSNLLKEALPYLIKLDNILYEEFRQDDKALGELIEKVAFNTRHIA